MDWKRDSLLTRLIALGLAPTVVVSGLLLASPTAAATDHPAVGRAASAERVLAEAKALFTGQAPAHARLARPSSSPRREPTLVLRDLARSVGRLTNPADRRTARSILARPTNSQDPTGGFEPKYAPGSAVGTTCGAHICVHWVEDGSADAVQDDGDVSTKPVWVSTTLTTMENVYDTEVTSLGYNSPLGDAGKGGNDKLDVYLADLGSQRLYGYCTSDDPQRGAARQVYGYCVLDNNYAASQYGTSHSPIENLQVTAAHEFFHAVQFGYDWTEDVWLMEATAAWMEDEVYNAVNDNRQYLADSPLSSPGLPLDYTDDSFTPYGSWIFWKFLSEWAAPGSASDPDIVRQVWTRAIGATYSTQALKAELAQRGSSFPAVFTTFGLWNRKPGSYYSEGSHYRAAPLDVNRALTSTHRGTGVRRVRLDHMTHSFGRLVPGTTLRGAWRLRVRVDMPAPSRGSGAVLRVFHRGGRVDSYRISLNRDGIGARAVAFSRSSVGSVELDLVNASTRFHCAEDTLLSCSGVPFDDWLLTTFSATAIR